MRRGGEEGEVAGAQRNGKGSCCCTPQLVCRRAHQRPPAASHPAQPSPTAPRRTSSERCMKFMKPSWWLLWCGQRGALTGSSK